MKTSKAMRKWLGSFLVILAFLLLVWWVFGNTYGKKLETNITKIDASNNVNASKRDINVSNNVNASQDVNVSIDMSKATEYPLVAIRARHDKVSKSVLDFSMGPMKQHQQQQTMHMGFMSHDQVLACVLNCSPTGCNMYSAFGKKGSNTGANYYNMTYSTIKPIHLNVATNYLTLVVTPKHQVICRINDSAEIIMDLDEPLERQHAGIYISQPSIFHPLQYRTWEIDTWPSSRHTDSKIMYVEDDLNLLGRLI